MPATTGTEFARRRSYRRLSSTLLARNSTSGAFGAGAGKSRRLEGGRSAGRRGGRKKRSNSLSSTIGMIPSGASYRPPVPSNQILEKAFAAAQPIHTLAKLMIGLWQLKYFPTENKVISLLDDPAIACELSSPNEHGEQFLDTPLSFRRFCAFVEVLLLSAVEDNAKGPEHSPGTSKYAASQLVTSLRERAEEARRLAQEAEESEGAEEGETQNGVTTTEKAVATPAVPQTSLVPVPTMTTGTPQRKGSMAGGGALSASQQQQQQELSLHPSFLRTSPLTSFASLGNLDQERSAAAHGAPEEDYQGKKKEETTKAADGEHPHGALPLKVDDDPAIADYQVLQAITEEFGLNAESLPAVERRSVVVLDDSISAHPADFQQQHPPHPHHHPGGGVGRTGSSPPDSPTHQRQQQTTPPLVGSSSAAVGTGRGSPPRQHVIIKKTIDPQNLVDALSDEESLDEDEMLDQFFEQQDGEYDGYAEGGGIIGTAGESALLRRSSFGAGARALKRRGSFGSILVQRPRQMLQTDEAIESKPAKEDNYIRCEDRGMRGRAYVSEEPPTNEDWRLHLLLVADLERRKCSKELLARMNARLEREKEIGLVHHDKRDAPPLLPPLSPEETKSLQKDVACVNELREQADAEDLQKRKKLWVTGGPKQAPSALVVDPESFVQNLFAKCNRAALVGVPRQKVIADGARHAAVQRRRTRIKGRSPSG